MRQVRIVVYVAVPSNWKRAQRFHAAVANAWHAKHLKPFRYSPIGIGVDWTSPVTKTKATAFNAAWMVSEALKVAGIVPSLDDVYFRGVKVTEGGCAKLILTLEE